MDAICNDALTSDTVVPDDLDVQKILGLDDLASEETIPATESAAMDESQDVDKVRRSGRQRNPSKRDHTAAQVEPAISADETEESDQEADEGPYCICRGPDDGRSVSYSPDGNRCVSVSEDETGRIWQLFGDARGACVHELKGHGAWVRDCLWAANNQCYTVSRDRSLRVWNSTTGECEATSILHSHIIWRVNVSGDGTRLVTSSEDGTAVIYDMESMQEIFCFAPRVGLRSCALSHNGKHAIFGAVDGTLYLTHFAAPRPRLQRHNAVDSGEV
jgi:WD40 repeat protein